MTRTGCSETIGRINIPEPPATTTSSSSTMGRAVALTGDTGYFWFFVDFNVEVIVKVLDGRGVNGYFWVFYGALSDVEYTLTVRDTVTGNVKEYFNPLRRAASVGDTEALPGG